MASEIVTSASNAASRVQAGGGGAVADGAGVPGDVFDAPPLSQVSPGLGDELLLPPATGTLPRLLPEARLGTGGQDAEGEYAHVTGCQDDVIRGEVRAQKLGDCVHRHLPPDKSPEPAYPYVRL